MAKKSSKSAKAGKSKMGRNPLDFTLNRQIRTCRIADSAWGRVTYKLRERDDLRWKGKALTKEAVFNLVWLWIDDMSVEQLTSAMALYLPRLEQAMLGKAQPPTKTDPAPVVEIETTDQVEVLPPKKSRRRPKSAG
jgi:hypothetical protein